MIHLMNNNQPNRSLAKTWQNNLSKREVLKNNYHAIGDMKKAKVFTSTLSSFSFKTDFASTVEQVIFSSDTLAIPIRAFAY